MRASPASLLAIAAALVASAASTPGAPDGISGSSSTFSVSLSAAAPDAEQRMTALLDAQAAIGDDGQISLTALFDDADVGQVQLSVLSETTGETSETSVLDPAAQPEVTIGINAFAGCDGLSRCEETLVVRFERLEADVTGDLAFDWQLDGAVSLVAGDADQPATGTLTLTPE